MKTLNNHLTRKFQRSSDRSPVLKFTPAAWGKLIYMRDVGDSEVGGFGISAEEDPLLVTDVQLVRQSCTFASVVFDDESVADFFDDQVDQGLNPSRFGRLWLHTHPGDSPRPSQTDEETFERVFGAPDYAVMFILAQQGQTYARLRFNVGPGGSIEIPTQVDYSAPFGASDHEAWDLEYQENVHVVRENALVRRGWYADDPPLFPQEVPGEWPDAWDEYVDGHEYSVNSGDLP